VGATIGGVKHLFLDESGSHNLHVVDPDYPVFVLGGVIIDGDARLATVDAAVRTFKTRFFGERDVTLRIPPKPNGHSTASRTAIPLQAEHLGAKRRVCLAKLHVLFGFRSTCRPFSALVCASILP